MAVNRYVKNASKLTPWLIGLAALAFVPALIIAFNPGSTKDWLASYWAGAAGGLMLELVGGGWGVELPSMGGKRPADRRFAPFGPWIDLGFLGRMATGAVAAPVFLVLINALLDGKSNEELVTIANNFDTLAWSVLVGMASPAAWKMGDALISARMGQVNKAVVAEHVEDVSKDLEGLAESAPTSEARVAIGKAIGKLESTQGLVAGVRPTSSSR